MQTLVPRGKGFLQGNHVGFHLFWKTDGSGADPIRPAMIKREYHVERSGLRVGIIQRHLWGGSAADLADRHDIVMPQDFVLQFVQIIKQRRQIGKLRPVRSVALGIQRHRAVLKALILGQMCDGIDAEAIDTLVQPEAGHFHHAFSKLGFRPVEIRHFL